MTVLCIEERESCVVEKTKNKNKMAVYCTPSSRQNATLTYTAGHAQSMSHKPSNVDIKLWGTFSWASLGMWLG